MSPRLPGLPMLIMKHEEYHANWYHGKGELGCEFWLDVFLDHVEFIYVDSMGFHVSQVMDH